MPAASRYRDLAMASYGSLAMETQNYDLAARIWLEAALWIVLVLGAFTLPALYDLYANPSAGLTLNDDARRGSALL